MIKKIEAWNELILNWQNLSYDEIILLFNEIPDLWIIFFWCFTYIDLFSNPDEIKERIWAELTVYFDIDVDDVKKWLSLSDERHKFILMLNDVENSFKYIDGIIDDLSVINDIEILKNILLESENYELLSTINDNLGT